MDWLSVEKGTAMVNFAPMSSALGAVPASAGVASLKGANHARNKSFSTVALFEALQATTANALAAANERLAQGHLHKVRAPVQQAGLGPAARVEFA